jgi:malate/lactate dehydrogenase
VQEGSGVPVLSPLPCAGVPGRSCWWTERANVRRRLRLIFATDHRFVQRRRSYGDYDDLADAALVTITAGINEMAGGAADRNDPEGRLRLLDKNAEIYRNIVPRVVGAAPGAVILVVTDPPDPLADIARARARA